MKTIRNLAIAAIAGLATAANADIAVVDPASIGLDPMELEKVRAELVADIAEKETPGAILLIARKGKVGFYAETGVQGPENPTPMNEDTIFRIYSMTKPIVSVAAMSMVEDGLLALDEPIKTYVPSFADMLVMDGETGVLSRAENDITVRHLMTHTAGIIYGVFAPDTILGKSYTNSQIRSFDFDLDELSVRLSKLPLISDPGSSWKYGRSTDVLGDIMEAAAGKPLDEIMQERVLGPLGMTETAFYRDADVSDRLAQSPPRERPLFDPTDVKPMFSGGGGMVSTIGDYLAFTQMLYNKGELNGERIIEEATLAEMTRDQLDGVDKSTFFPGEEYGFGLGFGVRIKEEGAYPGSVGDYYWGGYAGTQFWVDPSKELFTIMMVQNPDLGNHHRQTAREWTYRALAD